MTNLSSSAPSLLTALAAADRMTLDNTGDAMWVSSDNRFVATPTGLPITIFATRRTLSGVMRKSRKIAFAISSPKQNGKSGR